MSEIKDYHLSIDDSLRLSLPDCKAEYISYDDLPIQAKDRFEFYSSRFIMPYEYKPNDFDNLISITRLDKSVNFIATQKRRFEQSDTLFDYESLIYLVEMNPEGEKIGHAEIRHIISGSKEYKKSLGKVIVRFNNTDTSFRKMGYGKRRLILMGNLAKVFFNKPLHSDSLISDNAIKTWESLVREGLAKKIEDNKDIGFIFTG